MKRVVTVLGVLIIMGSSAASEFSTAIYHGNGRFYPSDPKSKSAGYAIDISVTRTSATSTDVTERLSGPKLPGVSDTHYAVTQRAGSSVYYDIQSEGSAIGWGYCFGITGGKKCHYEMDLDGVRHEIFFTVINGAIYRTSSFEDSKGGVTVTRESLSLDAPTPLE